MGEEFSSIQLPEVTNIDLKQPNPQWPCWLRFGLIRGQQPDCWRRALLKTVVFTLKREAGGGNEEGGEGLIKQVPGKHFEVHLKPNLNSCIHNAEQRMLLEHFHRLLTIQWPFFYFLLMLGPSWFEMVFWGPGPPLGRTRKIEGWQLCHSFPLLVPVPLPTSRHARCSLSDC